MAQARRRFEEPANSNEVRFMKKYIFIRNTIKASEIVFRLLNILFRIVYDDR